jgi:hypothetical protein
MSHWSTQKLLLTLGLACLVIVVFGLGFYFGFNYANKQINQSIVISNHSAESNTTNKEVKPVEGVFWIKSGEDPICPNTHPIKIKFDSGICFFYTKENKSYSRVKPNLCAVDENFALNEMGCLKKF